MLVTSVLLLALTAQAPVSAVDELATVAEKSDYKATARHEDVVALCRKIAAKSPLARFSEMGRTAEGRSIPLLILADPPVASPAEARKSGKIVALAIGDIHGGEVCGKEALPMLARELIAEPHPELLKNLIIVLSPVYNPDGNDRISKENRPGQVGPAEGTGTRGNARGLDLNRDFIKLEAPETRALVKLINEWDPHLFIDTHTTNGAHHRYTMTYDGPRVPAGDPSLIEYARSRMLPALTESFEKLTGHQAYYYGTFGGDHDRWESFPALGRFGTNYIGLRNRIGILSEAYAYAPYKTRVLATRDFVREILKYASTHKDEIKKLLDAARSSAQERFPKEPRRVALRTNPRPLKDAEPIQGFVEREQDGRRVATDEPRDYPSQVMVDFETTESAVRPFAYLLPVDQPEAVALLQRHGIDVQELREDLELEVEIYRVDEVERTEARGWDRQDVASLKATPRTDSRRIPAGTLVVKDAQPLGALAAYLLEPRSEDGLATWKKVAGVAAGADFPIVRLPKTASLLTTAAENLADEPTPPRPIRFNEYGVVEGGAAGFSGSAVAVEWIDDDHWLRPDENGPVKVEAHTGRAEPFLKSESLLESLKRIPGLPPQALPDLARRLATGGGGGRAGRLATKFDGSKKALVFEYEHDLYYITLDGSKGVRLTNDPGDETDPQFSPDGKRLAFVRNFDLHVVDVDNPVDRPLTTGGKDDLRHGRADWVYFEEIFDRSWSAYWWSPDSQRIAFLEFDDADVPTLTMLHDENSSKRVVEVNRYPRSGDPNPKVRLGIVPAAGGPVEWADLSAYSSNAFLISAVFWRPDSKSALACVQDRVQTWLDLLDAPVDGSRPRVLFRDQTKAWIFSPAAPSFLEDGSFLWLSSRDGWPHLYRYAADGALQGRLTDGEWEVRSIQHVDPRTGEVEFLATKDAPMSTQLYRVKPGGAVERITSGTGSYQTSHSPNGRRFVSTWSDLATPSRVRLHEADGSVIRTVDSNPVHKIKDFRFGAFERVKIPARDGCILEGEVVLPPDFDPARKYPVWFKTYGGPHTPVVSDVWAGGRASDQALASEGIIVFRADPRPASGKGQASAFTAYKQLGVQELEDIKDAVAWIKKRPYVDGSRIGMTGHSYGGYMTAYAMTHSDVFSCGIAGAPVTDWHDYDSIYTERLMGLPQDNPDGYKKSSVVEAARNLHGRLLIVHGAVDDNVSVRNTMRFVEELQKANKDFELMIYPGSRHGIMSSHYPRLQLDFIRRNLLGNERASAAGKP